MSYERGHRASIEPKTIVIKKKRELLFMLGFISGFIDLISGFIGFTFDFTGVTTPCVSIQA